MDDARFDVLGPSGERSPVQGLRSSFGSPHRTGGRPSAEGYEGDSAEREQDGSQSDPEHTLTSDPECGQDHQPHTQGDGPEHAAPCRRGPRAPHSLHLDSPEDRYEASQADQQRREPQRPRRPPYGVAGTNLRPNPPGSSAAPTSKTMTVACHK